MRNGVGVYDLQLMFYPSGKAGNKIRPSIIYFYICEVVSDDDIVKRFRVDFG